MSEKKAAKIISLNTGYEVAGEVSPEDVLKSVMEENLREILVIAVSKDNNDVYFSSSGNKKDMLFLLENFKHRLLSGDYDG